MSDSQALAWGELCGRPSAGNKGCTSEFELDQAVLERKSEQDRAKGLGARTQIVSRGLAAQ